MSRRRILIVAGNLSVAVAVAAGAFAYARHDNRVAMRQALGFCATVQLNSDVSHLHEPALLSGAVCSITENRIHFDFHGLGRYKARCEVTQAGGRVVAAMVSDGSEQKEVDSRP